jgi:hypothetical protein
LLGVEFADVAMQSVIVAHDGAGATEHRATHVEDKFVRGEELLVEIRGDDLRYDGGEVGSVVDGGGCCWSRGLCPGDSIC